MLTDENIMFPIGESESDSVTENYPPLFPCPHPPFSDPTIEAEFKRTVALVSDNVRRVLQLEKCIRDTVDKLSKDLTSDNVTFKNMCTETYNRFALGVFNDVTTFKSAITNSYELSKAELQLAYDRFSESINARVAEIPSIISDKVKEHIENGAFADQIAEMEQEVLTVITDYMDEIEARSNAIIASAGNDNTEIVDARVGADGVTYDTAGQAMRTQFKNMSKSRLGMAILLPASNGEYPSISTTEKTFTIGGDTLLINDRLKNGFVSLLESNGNNRATWGDDITTSAICFYYDITLNKLVALPYSADITDENYILIATLRTHWKESRAVCSCPIYVDGVLSTAPFQIGGFVALLPTFDTVTSYPLYNTKTNKITFANDTLIIDPRLPSTFVSLSETNNNNVVDLSEYETSAICVYYGIKENALVVKPYSTKVNAFDYLLICAVRKPTPTTRGMAWASCPVWIDDRLSTEEISHINTGKITTVKAINHRGYCSEAPENTLTAFKLSKKMGFDFVECDVAFTFDNEPVLLHDTTIDRTSNGTGDIANLTLEHVRGLDFGTWKSVRFAGEKIPTFTEFIALCKSLGLHAYVEIKAGTAEQIKKLVNIVRMYGMRENVTFISFFSDSLVHVKSFDTRARLGYIVETVTETAIEIVSSLRTDKNDVFIDVSSNGLNDSAVSMCASADIPLEVWTVNDTNAITSMNPYITGVTSDSAHVWRVLSAETLTGTMTPAPANIPID